METTHTPDKLIGSVERITFQNEENGYCVMRVKARGKRELITLVGFVSHIAPGETLEATGTWTNHREFGLQFKADSIQTAHPSTLEGIERYLGSGMVRGIGPHFAKKMVEVFGDRIFEVIEKEPEKLRRVPGIGRGRLEKIVDAWGEQKAVREIMVFLQSHGVGTGRAVRIHKSYGAQAIDRVSENPYRLARDISGIGFKTADQIASNLGVPKDSPMRARAGLSHVLEERISDGHCAFPEEALLEETAALLEVEHGILQAALADELADHYLIRDTIHGRSCLYTAATYAAETGIVGRLMSLREAPVPWGEIDREKAVGWVNQRLHVSLGDLQKIAVEEALRSKVMIITGGPGTGKTTLTRAITTILAAKQVRISLCSPTGRAAKRLSECTGMEAKTIHRLLGFDRAQGGFLRSREDPLETDLLILDEASMVDVFLMYSLLKALPDSAAILIVGDVDQIPSVGPGAVLQSLIQSQAVRTIRLTQIFRQVADSRIISNAHRINQGEMPSLDGGKDSDFHFFSSDEAEKTISTVIDLVKTRIPRKFQLDPLRDIQILCPMNRGGLGAHALNVELQKAFNPSPAVKVERFGFTFAPGDKVMVTSNDYDKEVFNGDIGFLRALDLDGQEATLDFDGRAVSFRFGEMDILALAYATTIHKAQGSEYPVVVLVLAMQHFLMLKRNLLYTGVTRGKRLVVIVGQKRALATAVDSPDQGVRWTKLDQRLREATSLSSSSPA